RWWEQRDLQVEFAAGLPLRRQLEGQLREAIRSGRLGTGSALPPSRVLAEELGVSRGVVVDCYSQLTVEGYLAARTGSGTRVAYAPVPPQPAASLQPRAAAAWRRRSVTSFARPGRLPRVPPAPVAGSAHSRTARAPGPRLGLPRPARHPGAAPRDRRIRPARTRRGCHG